MTLPLVRKLADITGAAPGSDQVGYEIKTTKATVFDQSTPVAGTIYDVTDLYITVLPGAWDIFLSLPVQIGATGAGQATIHATLRTGSTTLVSTVAGSALAGAASVIQTAFITLRVYPTISTVYKASIYYVNASGTPTVSNIYARGDQTTNGAYILARRV